MATKKQKAIDDSEHEPIPPIPWADVVKKLRPILASTSTMAFTEAFVETIALRGYQVEVTFISPRNPLRGEIRARFPRKLPRRLDKNDWWPDEAENATQHQIGKVAAMRGDTLPSGVSPCVHYAYSVEQHVMKLEANEAEVARLTKEHEQMANAAEQTAARILEMVERSSALLATERTEIAMMLRDRAQAAVLRADLAAIRGDTNAEFLEHGKRFALSEAAELVELRK